MLQTAQSKANFDRGWDSLKKTNLQRDLSEYHSISELNLGENSEYINNITNIFGNSGLSHETRIEKAGNWLNHLGSSFTCFEKSYFNGLLDKSEIYITENQKRIKNSNEALGKIKTLREKLDYNPVRDFDMQPEIKKAGLNYSISEMINFTQTAETAETPAPNTFQITDYQETNKQPQATDQPTRAYLHGGSSNGRLSNTGGSSKQTLLAIVGGVAIAGVVIGAQVYGRFQGKQVQQPIIASQETTINAQETTISQYVLSNKDLEKKYEVLKEVHEKLETSVENFSEAVEPVFEKYRNKREAKTSETKSPEPQEVIKVYEAPEVEVKEPQAQKSELEKVADYISDTWLDTNCDLETTPITASNNLDNLGNVNTSWKDRMGAFPRSEADCDCQDYGPWEYGNYLEGVSKEQKKAGKGLESALTWFGSLGAKVNGLAKGIINQIARPVGATSRTLTSNSYVLLTKGEFAKENTWQVGADDASGMNLWFFRNSFGGPNMNKEDSGTLEFLSGGNLDFKTENADPYVCDDGLAGFSLRTAERLALLYWLDSGSDGGSDGGNGVTGSITGGPSGTGVVGGVSGGASGGAGGL